MMRQNEARRRTPVLVMLDVRPGAHDRGIVRARGRSVRVDRDRDRPHRPARRSDAGHRHDDRYAGPPSPRHRDGRAGGRRAARPRANRRAPSRAGAPARSSRSSVASDAIDAAALAVLVRDGGQLTVVACVPEATDLVAALAPFAAAVRDHERNRATLHRLMERGSGPMAAQRSSIAVGVARASLTLATAFALTRVFAGRSWLFVDGGGRGRAPGVPRLGATAPLARAGPAGGGHGGRRLARRRSSPTRRPRSPGSRRARRSSALAARVGPRAAHACAPRSFPSRPSAPRSSSRSSASSSPPR